MSKRLFLGCYDYGMGGLWALIQARSIDEVRAKYPCLTLWDGLPEWQAERGGSFGINNAFDIDRDPPDWLRNAMIEYRP